jgi:hypothetical protein
MHSQSKLWAPLYFLRELSQAATDCIGTEKLWNPFNDERNPYSQQRIEPNLAIRNERLARASPRLVASYSVFDLRISELIGR